MATKKKTKAATKKRLGGVVQTARKKTDSTGDFLNKVFGEFTLGTVMKGLRQGREMTQEEFGKLLGSGKSYISDIENGRVSVSMEQAANFARILEYSELVFVQLAIDDAIRRSGLKYKVEVREVS